MDHHLEDQKPRPGREALLEILAEALALISRPANDFVWSHWDDAVDAQRELAILRGKIINEDPHGLLEMNILFGPTGPMQEVSLSSGWGDEFLDLAERFDQTAAQME